MTIQVDYRVVGLYAYYPHETIEGFTESSTVEQVMNHFKGKYGVEYMAGPLGAGKPDKVMSFTYTLPDIKPIPNALVPTVGERSLRQVNADEFAAALSSGEESGENDKNQVAIWQYYRSAVIKPKGDSGGSEMDVRIREDGQPPFKVATISNGFTAPEGWEIDRYRLIWRLITIDIKRDKALEFQDAYKGMV